MLRHKVPENWREMLEEAYAKPLKECSWQEAEVRKTRSKSAAERLAYRILRRLAEGDTNAWPIASDFEAVGPDYRPDDKIPKATLKRWYKQPLFKAQIMEAMQKKLENLDITPDRALRLLSGTIEQAEEGGSISERNQVFDRMDRVLGLTDKKRVTEEIGFDYTRAIGGGEEKGRLTAKRTRGLEPGEFAEIKEVGE